VAASHFSIKTQLLITDRTNPEDTIMSIKYSTLAMALTFTLAASAASADGYDRETNFSNKNTPPKVSLDATRNASAGGVDRESNLRKGNARRGDTSTIGAIGTRPYLATAEEGDFLQTETSRRDAVPQKSTGSCLEVVGTCTAAEGTAVRTCGAVTLASLGTMSAGCLAIFGGTTLACAAGVISYCGSIVGTAVKSAWKSVFHGSSLGTNDIGEEQVCGGHEFVNKLRVEYSPISQRVTRTIFYCTDGDMMFVGEGQPDQSTFTCPDGYFGAGIRLRAGSEIDAAGLICRNKDGNRWDSPLKGSAGGDAKDTLCPSDRLFVGVNAVYDGPLDTGRRMKGISAMCR
jgi:hypothetical protein